MGTIAQQAPHRTPELDPSHDAIGPLAALLDELAAGGPVGVAELRVAVGAAIAGLPAGDPLAGAGLDGAGEPMLVRLATRLVVGGR